MFVQEGMHLHRKTSAAHGQQPPFVCLSLEGSPSRAAAAAPCLRFITGKKQHTGHLLLQKQIAGPRC